MENMKMIKYALCTLFDSNYLDKGLVLYDSLVKSASNFTLYVLAMNEKCFEVLTDMDLPNLVPVKLADFEDEELQRVKKTRSIGEYCWTCSSSLIRYVLNTYHPDYCTYIDADMYFYSDPIVVIDEMDRKNASVQIVGHRFCKESAQMANTVGKYCVEFDTFKNDTNGLELVNIWRNQCLKHCSIDGDGVYWGDQKYQDKWCDDYNYVIETENIGVGVAPWNLPDYKLQRIVGDTVDVKCNNKTERLVFYHFERIKYITDSIADINAYWTPRVEDKLVKALYLPYLRRVREKKQFLKDKYGLDVLLKTHPGVQNDKEIKNQKRRSWLELTWHYVKRSRNPINWLRYIVKVLPRDIAYEKNIMSF